MATTTNDPSHKYRTIQAAVATAKTRQVRQTDMNMIVAIDTPVEGSILVAKLSHVRASFHNNAMFELLTIIYGMKRAAATAAFSCARIGKNTCILKGLSNTSHQSTEATTLVQSMHC